MFTFIKNISSPSKTIYDKFNSMSHDKFIKLIFLSTSKQKIKGATFPSFPEDSTQIGMVGSCGETALYEPKNFYLKIHDIAKQKQNKFTSETKVLDFGCGFGRMYRFFMKDVAPGNLIGTEVNKDFYQICLDTFPSKESSFMVNTPFPPLPFDDSTFNIIYLYSIFTHLSEECFLAWLQEFHRVLKPNGLLFFTLRQQSFLNTLAKQFTQYTNTILDKYTKQLYSQFSAPEIQTTYDKGDFIFFPNGGGHYLNSSFYGDTVIPPQYIEKVIKQKNYQFELITNIDDPSFLPQAFTALQVNK